MNSPSLHEQEWSQFVCALFEPTEGQDNRCGPLAKFRGDALADDIVAFSRHRDVLKATQSYLQQVYTLWARSRVGNEALESATDQVTQPPGTLASQPVPAPEQALLESLSERPLPTAQPGVASPETPDPSIAAPTAASPTPAGSAALSQVARPGQIPPAGAPQGKPMIPQATFHLPNAKVGQAYVGRLEGKGPSGQPVTIVDVELLSTLGLSFDPQSSEIRGIPAIDGDHRFAVRWKAENGALYRGEGQLTVNPDPRSLWKKIDPPADDPYFKDNTDGKLVEGPSFRIAAASRRGRSHEHVGTFRDDDFFVNHDVGSGWSVIIVADGAGSAKSSRQGSKLAVIAAGEHLVVNLNAETGATLSQALAAGESDRAAASKVVGDTFHYLFHKAASLAVQAIETEAAAQGAAVKDYSTTLLAAAVKRSGSDTFVASFWMGDGAIATYGSGGLVKLMGTPDGGEFAGQTRFLDKAALSDQGFGKRIRCERFSNLSAVLLMTDGVSDPRFETDNGLVDSAKWDGLWAELSPSLTSQEPDKALIEWLDFFTPGHHDDRTIAVLW